MYGKYNTVQLRSLSFIHFCCCHVIHAVAKSLNTTHIDKKIRQSVLHIFTFILCGNDINQLYDTLGSVISIFGDPNEQNTKENFKQMLSLLLIVDEESAAVLSDRKKIFKEAKERNEKLRFVDEYLRSSTTIIHQSPFNVEAIRRHPNLTILINKKSKYNNVVNPLFSPSIIRIFYRWWPYLPLWTGLLWNFEERYSTDNKKRLPVVYNPVRHSNAIVESYFRTMKHSIYNNKRNNTPGSAITKLYRSIQAQFKAFQFGVTQSSKGRKRRKKNQKDPSDQEIWCKNDTRGKCRNFYTKTIDKFISKRARLNAYDSQSDYIIKNIRYIQ